MPTFAFSVPVGSWHPFLAASLASLRAQGAGVSVALLDASGDPRVKALADLHDDWLAYRRHGPDGGQSDAIIEGWQHVQGDWLGWLNADDILMPGALDKVRSRLAQDSSLDVVYGHSSIIDETGAMTGYHFNVEPPGPRLLQAGIISQPSCFFRRSACEGIGGVNPDLHYVMDWDLWIRMYEADAKFDFVDAPLSMVLWGEDTKTASLNKRRRSELQDIINRHAPPEARTGTFRAFVVHAAADRMWPAGLREKLRRRLRRSGPTVFGVRADGLVQPGASLILAHYDDAPKTGLTLEFDCPATGVNVNGTPKLEAVGKTSSSIEIRLARPLPANETLRVNLSAAPNHPVRFLRAAWQV
ncbi:MAG: glycosyltransferase [Alphaproteobacteria bacterium]|nr:glycosyltransferase [Alphaproteobacteria bacterium]MBU2082826.1 glycosyltransferase [Alphaproteobacteria bacterium]MBU2142990.1 glycosyltransferase [Alphaproteobacteria bacterium]MBU2196584.1 glycosyltransferase [Alphaproteobacteria bacterium]